MPGWVMYDLVNFKGTKGSALVGHKPEQGSYPGIIAFSVASLLSIFCKLSTQFPSLMAYEIYRGS